MTDRTSEDVAMPPQLNNPLNAPRRWLLLASYCGGDTEGCTDDKPCVACIAMCSTYATDGEYLGQLGELAVPDDMMNAFRRRIA